jgi:protein required for attachment to host cells
MKLPKGALVAVCDGAKLLLFKNTGEESEPNLTAVPVPTVDDDHMGAGRGHRSSAANPDNSGQDEDAYAAGIAAMLNQRVLSGAVENLIVIAAPRTLGELRHHWHAKLKDVLVGEISKDLTGASAAQIEAAIAKG